MLIFRFFIVVISFVLSTSILSQETIIKVHVTGIRSSKGNLAIGIYKDQATFGDRNPYYERKVSKQGMKNGNLSFDVKLPEGVYGVTLLDDENVNGKCDYGFILPNEGFGFSDYFHTGILPPRFKDFKFALGNVTKEVVVKVKYY